MTARLWAIGDIHGCATALQAIWKQMAPTADDTVVLLGDYLDRGHDSRGVIEFLIAHTQVCQVIPLLGNHERMCLEALRDRRALRRWLEWGGQTTLDSYGEAGSIRAIPPEHRAWLAACRTYYETAEHFFVHANYDPQLPLRAQYLDVLLERSLDEVVPGPHPSGKRAMVGHTPQLTGSILVLPHLCCVDTGCGLGGWLTALEVGTGRAWQVDEMGRTKPTSMV